MLKKVVWFVLHILSVTLLAVLLILGVLYWGAFDFGSYVFESGNSYEFSDYYMEDMQIEADMLWEYFEAKQMLYVIEPEEEATADQIYEILIEMGLTDEDMKILAGEFGLTEVGLYEFFLEKLSLTSEELQSFIEAYRNGAYTTDEMNVKADASEEWSFEDYLQAQEQLEFGDMRYDTVYTNVRYTIQNGETVLDSNLPEEKETYDCRIWTEQQGEYTLYVYLNTDYPADDYYREISAAYNQFQNIKWYLVSGILLSMVLSLLSIGMLTGLCGKRKGSTQIALSWMDHPPLEIAVVLWGAMAVAVLSFLIVIGKNLAYEQTLVWLIIFAVSVFIADFVALNGYLSLIRRIKSRTFFKNSICYRVIAWIGRMINNVRGITKVSQRVLLVCTGYLILMLLMVFLGGKMAALVAIVLSLAAVWCIYKDAMSRQKVIDGMQQITSGELDYQIDLTKINSLQHEVAEAANQVGTSMKKAVEQSLKDERLKTDLITNVSHDIKTPLTSIINYVDLLKREDIKGETAKGYLDILDQKSQRLKQLTEDLVEASKLSSGNVVLNMEKMDFNEILQQALGEFEEKFQEKQLQVILKRPEGRVAVMGEGRRIWRILENLFQNVYKYAMPGTRVYAELIKQEDEMVFLLKNISQHSLNIEADDLTERFIRGDVSRTTEGSGLGLSIARDLATLQKGGFEIQLDGDLFKAILRFELIREEE